MRGIPNGGANLPQYIGTSLRDPPLDVETYLGPSTIEVREALGALDAAIRTVASFPG